VAIDRQEEMSAIDRAIEAARRHANAEKAANPPPSDLAAELDRVRKELRLPVAVFAGMLAIGAKHYAAISDGSRPMTLAQARRAHAFGVSAAALLGQQNGVTK
jgi:hypothetical protein